MSGGRESGDSTPDTWPDDAVRVVEPFIGWEDLDLPEPQLSQLRTICEEAGASGPGSGPPLLLIGADPETRARAAEAMAGALRLPLFRIDLAALARQYIGETEKNLGRLFERAETESAVLLFDEADALFGRRTSVKDSHDRYANLEVAYLLQKLEAYPGTAILAANVRNGLDDRAVRRMRHVVELPAPPRHSGFLARLLRRLGFVRR